MLNKFVKTGATLFLLKFKNTVHLMRSEKDGVNLESNQIILLRFEIEGGYDSGKTNIFEHFKFYF